MNFTSIIPIKLNSQRLPNKNFKKINGYPLFSYIINTLLNVDCIDQIVINTDHPVINEFIRSHFDDDRIIFYERKAEHKGDDVSVNKLIKDMVTNCVEIKNDFYIQTHVTNPCLTRETIDAALCMYTNKITEYDSCFGVTRYFGRFYDHNYKPINHNIDELKQTQDLEPIYYDNSNFYIFSKKVLEEYGRRFGKNPLFFPVAHNEAIDIDTYEDFVMAEYFLRHGQEERA